MARGQYLRTNYRKTGGVVDITGIGGGYPLASATNGAGTTTPYGGFVYVTSFAGSWGGSTRTFSNELADSAYGIMSLFYGSGQFDSGYKFLPIGFNWRSVSDWGFSTDSLSNAALPDPKGISIAFTDSIFRIFGVKAQNIGSGSAVSYLSFSGEEVLLDIWGFIVSSP